MTRQFLYLLSSVLLLSTVSAVGADKPQPLVYVKSQPQPPSGPPEERFSHDLVSAFEVVEERLRSDPSLTKLDFSSSEREELRGHLLDIEMKLQACMRRRGAISEKIERLRYIQELEQQAFQKVLSRSMRGSG
jgi:hypothetical protein